MGSPNSESTSARAGKKQKPFSLVGVGASAGGLDALEAFFDQLPEDSGMAFVVVTHLSADRESHLDELLQLHTPMPVLPVEGRMQIEPNHVYVLRPGRDLGVDGRHLMLHERPKDDPVRKTVDRFFSSLAEGWDGQAVGIVLTGSGSDGTRGVAAIKEAGGLTMAQTPEDAQYPSMPEHAINDGHIDVEGTAGELAEKVLAISRGRTMQGPPLTEASLDESDRKVLQQILTRLRTETGHEFTGYKRSTILRRIGRRIRLHQLESLEEYLDMLRLDAREVRRLYQDLLIPVTRFFRDGEVYETLQERIVPRLFDGKESGDELRIWVPGCATGEEAYSLAMLFEEARTSRDKSIKLQLFATDVDRQAVEKGRRGRYPEVIASDVSENRLKRFFMKQGSSYQVKEHVRESVLFAVHDVIKDPPFSDVDLISCRNLLIYLDKERQKRVFERFHFALRPGGYLVLGSSESTSAAPDLFKTVDQSSRIYHQRPGMAKPMRFSMNDGRLRKQPSIDRDDGAEQTSGYSEQHRRLLVRRYAPTSILVDEDYHILDVTHGESPFLKYPEKSPPHSVEDVVVEALRPELRSGLFRLFKKDVPTVRKLLPIERLGRTREVLLTVRGVDFGENLAHVVLESGEEAPAESVVDAEQTEIDPSASATIRELDEELQQTKERLRSTVEGYETRTEELRSSNEELLAMNEELESTTEELETREEELQAMNEELTAVNNELEQKVEEVEEAYNDLNNFVAATHVAALFLDEELQVRRFTPEADELFTLDDRDQGRPLTEVPHRLAYDRLFDDARKVLDTGQKIKCEITTREDRWYVMQLRPYRTADHKIGGVAVSFFDITDRKEVEQRLERLNKELEERVIERTRELEAMNERLKTQMAERERLEQEVLEVSEEERWRIGESLHEDAGQALTGIMLLLDDHIRRLKEENSETVEAVQQIRDLLEEVDKRLLDLARGIIPLQLGKGDILSRALSHLADEMAARYDISCKADVRDEVSFASDEHATHVYRIVQEAVQNAVLHGDASEISIELKVDDGDRLLSVTDNGSGPDGDIDQMGKKGMGVRLMQYRCRLLNGDFSIAECVNGGMQVVCRFPLSDVPQHQ